MNTDTSIAGAHWDRMIPAASEDRLMLLEQTHRLNNEVASVLAALHLIRNASGAQSQWHLLRSAIERLEGFATVNRVLAVAAGPVRLDVEFDRLCLGLSAAREDAKGSIISLDLAPVQVCGTVARRALLVAAELIHNAVRHALQGREGKLAVVLREIDDHVAIAVIDDGPGLASPSRSQGSGLGGPLVRELVRRAGGQVDVDTGPEGTTFTVSIPKVEPETA